jgi:hypothetical protein
MTIMAGGDIVVGDKAFDARICPTNRWKYG